MASNLLLFGAAMAGSIVGLNIVLKPKVFRLVMKGIAGGIVVGGIATSMNSYRSHTIKASYVPYGISQLRTKFDDIQRVIYKDLSSEYEERGELDLGEEHITVQPTVFAQIGIVDCNGVRQMWTRAILPVLKAGADTGTGVLVKHDTCFPELEKSIVFCDIGSGVGNVCLQVLAETHCEKTVGVDVIPSRIRASQQATQNAKQYYPDVFAGKEALWYEMDLVDCATLLDKQMVNVVFSHSWMFDDNLMERFSEVVASVPSIQCVITSRKLSEAKLRDSSLKLVSAAHFSADWNDEAPFFIYGKRVGRE